MNEVVNRVKLSQWDALTLEALRARGWSDEELLRKVADQDLPVDESKYQFDFSRLTELLKEEPDVLELAVRSGYQIKYSTIGGIRSWIDVALGKEAAADFTEGEEKVEAYLTKSEKTRLEAVLSYGRHISHYAEAADGGAALCRIEPVRQ